MSSIHLDAKKDGLSPLDAFLVSAGLSHTLLIYDYIKVVLLYPTTKQWCWHCGMSAYDFQYTPGNYFALTILVLLGVSEWGLH